MSYKSFNSTGRDDSTTEIIKPKGDAKRKATFIAVAVVLAIGLCLYGFSQTGLNPFSPPESSRGLGAGHSVDISKPTD